MRRVHFLIFAWILFRAFSSHAVPTSCGACGGAFNGGIVSYTDQVDRSTKWICESCADRNTVCYHCGVPAWKGIVTLSDGRVLCERDQVGIVLDEDTALAICRDVDGTLESLLSRFTAFPSTNVEVRLADRIDVRALVGVAGYDYSCPNLLGYTLSLQKSGYQLHQIRLLTGLQKGVLQSTYAHELAHAWVSENVSRARELELRGDAAEGFCELIGYLVAEAYRDETAKSHILQNQYTRGQVLLFVETERRFGMGDVLDWMREGTGNRLRAGRLIDIRDVDPSSLPLSKPVSEILFIPKMPARQRTNLELTSITRSSSLSVATINGRAFEVKEERKVPMGGSNIVLRCLAIEEESVLVEHVNSGKQQRLSLRHPEPADSE